MPIVTITKNQAPLLIEFDIDNSALALVAVRVDNTDTIDYYVEAIQTDGAAGRKAAPGRKYGSVFRANTRTEIAIPTATGQRLYMELDARGRWDGVDLSVRGV